MVAYSLTMVILVVILSDTVDGCEILQQLVTQGIPMKHWKNDGILMDFGIFEKSSTNWSRNSQPSTVGLDY